MIAFVSTTGGEVLPGFIAPELAAKAADLRSATKSITALLVGIAIDRGEIASVDANVAALLPEYAKQFADDPRKRAMTIADLLTMRSGLACDDWDATSPGHEDKMYRRRDWLEFWSRQPMRDEPGARYSYCTGNAVALGRILAHATGMPADRYAEQVLFSPLGISGARWESWNRGKDVDTGGHLRLGPEALLRVGEMVLAGGMSAGRRIVSARWIESMTSVHSAIPDRNERYGYLWWLAETTLPTLPKTRLWMAWGNGGNFLIVLPELATVVVFNGTRFNRPEALQPLGWLRDRLLPAWGPAPPGP